MAFPPPPQLPEEFRMAPNDAAELRREAYELLGIQRRGGFPGSQPVSFDRTSLQALELRDFYVCEKSDGVRCLMYLTFEAGVGEVAYLWDRRDDFYQITGAHFPKVASDPASFWVKTVVDGELVNDIEPDGNVVKRFLAFDLLVLDGKKLTDRSLDKRLAYMQEQLYKPYNQLFTQYPDELQAQPFQFVMKKMELSYGIEMLFRDILPRLKHGNDGLIFTCRETPYVNGTDPNIIKWKPPHENSIDFKLRLVIPLYKPEDGGEPFPDYDTIPTLELYVKGNRNEEDYRGNLYVTELEWEKLKNLNEPLDERIVEAHLDTEKRWRFMRFRDDKNDANHITTVVKVLDSINDAITEQQLIDSAGKVKKQWKARAERAAAGRGLSQQSSQHSQSTPH